MLLVIPEVSVVGRAGRTFAGAVAVLSCPCWAWEGCAGTETLAWPVGLSLGLSAFSRCVCRRNKSSKAREALGVMQFLHALVCRGWVCKGTFTTFVKDKFLRSLSFGQQTHGLELLESSLLSLGILMGG